MTRLNEVKMSANGERALIVARGRVVTAGTGNLRRVNIAVPATIAAGRAIYVTYTGPGLGQPGAPPLPGNTCSQISFQ